MTSQDSGSGSGGSLTPITAPLPAGQDLRISGDPVPAVRVAQEYIFEPEVTSAEQPVQFSIQNLPSWASFDEATGRLSGTPTSAEIGTYRGIVITATNSAASASLPAFDVAVTQIATGTAQVSWTPPLKNTNGSALTDLSGFQIHVGRSAAKLTRLVDVTDPSISNFLVEDLSAGSWYFAVAAVNSIGAQSALSAVRSKVIR